VSFQADGARAQMQLPLAPFAVDGDRGSIRSAPRPVGADTDAVLGELGVGADELAQLRADGTI
jgi:crotonobetainyl-CoA:carnitine CoA-transferase CaiB-like acyl-CoA transferase